MRFFPAPLRRQRASAFLAVLLAFPTACNDVESPTGPNQPPAPGSTVADLNGAWAGTLVVSYDGYYGPWDSCTESVSATIVQRGSTVSGTLVDTPECGGTNRYLFNGQLRGEQLSGTVALEGKTGPMTAIGRGSSGHVSLSAFNVTWELAR